MIDYIQNLFVPAEVWFAVSLAGAKIIYIGYGYLLKLTED